MVIAKGLQKMGLPRLTLGEHLNFHRPLNIWHAKRLFDIAKIYTMFMINVGYC